MESEEIIKGVPENKRTGREKELRTYICYYCNFKFKQYVGSIGGGKGTRGRKIRRVSSQVTCPNCGNFLPTW